MKRVISTKVDQTVYAEFLEYCAKKNKYPANALRDALELLLGSEKAGIKEKLSGPFEVEQEPKEREKSKTDADEDEAELE
jgi:hypothetical protein